MLACFGKTRQGVFKKKEPKMPTLTPLPPNPSTTATPAALSASTPSEVSFTFDSIKQFADAFLSRFEQSQKFTQDMLIDLTMQNKEKKNVNDYSTFSPNPSFSVAPSENYQYGMPPNYFAGQTPQPGSVRPSRAEPIRSVAPTGLTGALAGGPVRPVKPVPWCLVLRRSHRSHLLLLRLIIAWSENWWILCRRIRRSHMVNLLSLHHCPRMFGMIGLGPIRSMPHK